MGSIYKRGNVFWIKYYRSGKALRESSRSTKESDAKRLLKLREGDIVRGVPVTPRIGRIKFDELAQDMVNDYKVNGKKTLKDLEMRLRRHLLPFFGHHRASNVTTSSVRRFVNLRQEQGATNVEINRELTALKRAFNLGIQAGKLMTKPYVPMLKENNVRTGFFERDQFESVRHHLPEQLRALVTFFYVTGWRLSEVFTLRWHQVDFEAGRVYLEPGTTKNDEGRIFPFTDDLRNALEVQRRYTDEIQGAQDRICPWVFHREGKRVKSIRKAWATACRKAGVPGRIPHDFRRTAVRNLVRAGVPERVAMQMTGHKTRSVFERYNIVSEGDLEEAARRLNEKMGTTSAWS